MPAKPLTTSQRDDADRLKALFVAWQARQEAEGRRASQEELTDHFGFGQSALSQYLNGNIPLNLKAAVKFAKLLNCEVADFSPSLGADIEGLTLKDQPTPPKRIARSSMEITFEPDALNLSEISRVLAKAEERVRKHVGRLMAEYLINEAERDLLAAKILAVLEPYRDEDRDDDPNGGSSMRPPEIELAEDLKLVDTGIGITLPRKKRIRS